MQCNQYTHGHTHQTTQQPTQASRAVAQEESCCCCCCPRMCWLYEFVCLHIIPCLSAATTTTNRSSSSRGRAYIAAGSFLHLFCDARVCITVHYSRADEATAMAKASAVSCVHGLSRVVIVHGREASVGSQKNVCSWQSVQKNRREKAVQRHQPVKLSSHFSHVVASSQCFFANVPLKP